jgi:hypothetical protein
MQTMQQVISEYLSRLISFSFLQKQKEGIVPSFFYFCSEEADAVPPFTLSTFTVNLPPPFTIHLTLDPSIAGYILHFQLRRVFLLFIRDIVILVPYDHSRQDGSSFETDIVGRIDFVLQVAG